MRSTLLLTATLASAAALAPPALGAQPPKTPNTPGPDKGYALTIGAQPRTIVFGSSVVLAGRLTGPVSSAVGVRLERDDSRPFGDGFVPFGTVVPTAQNGAWSLTAKPAVTTLYRAVAATSPRTTSAPQRVNVRPRIRLSLSDRTPRRGTLVRFSGTVAPAHDGATVRLQKRTSTGGWVTVATKRLGDDGTARSSYSRRLRVRASGVYRVKLPEHLDHTNGFSPLRSATVR